MRVIQHEWTNVSRSTVFKITPIGDIHLGAAACDETLLKAVIDGVKNEENAYWIGQGDYCDFINRKDPRYDPEIAASWLNTSKADLVIQQKERFLELFKPIAHKCLAMLEGNHETAIKKHTERDIFGELVSEIKRFAMIPEDKPLGLGYYGWLLLDFYRGASGEGLDAFRFNLHHGFAGGKLAGAKALEMQRWLWTHNADVVIFGHSHNTSAQKEMIEDIDRSGNIVYQVRRGCYAGTFLRTINEGAATYSEIRGYLPLPVGGAQIEIRPGAHSREHAIKVIT